MYYNPNLKNENYLGKLKVGIVDDHVMVRDSLASTINGYGDYIVMLRAIHGQDMIKQLKSCANPEIIILDLNMPVMDGYETASWLADNHPEVNVLVVTMFDSETTLLRLLKSGVRAFLKKDAHPNELKYALKALMKERYYYPQTISRKIANVFQNPDQTYKTQPLILTDKEIRFLQLCSTDLTYKQMAGELLISPRTVDNYRDKLFSKLNVKTRVELVVYAMKNGIITF